MLSAHGSRIPLRGGSRNHVCLWTIYPWRFRAVETRQFGCGAGCGGVQVCAKTCQVQATAHEQKIVECKSSRKVSAHRPIRNTNTSIHSTFPSQKPHDT